ncbi:MAG TPA: aldehyde ferredoxin oxidoreductase family protein [Dehalococcoidales bacterium]
MGKLLFVNLSTGKIEEEPLDEKMCRDFIGGYGFGVKILYNRQKAGVAPLGPENMLGFITGPLTGTPTPTGTRYTVVAKSPLTGTWGEANSGGQFGPYLKFAGYDGVFFTGISAKPVYLLIDDGKVELRDAGYLWGKDTCETENVLQAEHGPKSQVACIGPSGERLSLISCIITDKGAAAARSGLGAVMGSKKLKAVVAKGDQTVPLADKEAVENMRKQYLTGINDKHSRQYAILQPFRKYGTALGAARSAHAGDSPVKNWGGIGVVDFPDVSGIEAEKVIANLDKRTGCWHCPMVCQASLKEGTGEYKYVAGSRRPEYETLASFGCMCLNNDTESIAMANYICNRYGLDTISAGTTIAFAIECYENGLITKKDTQGIELTWGNHRSIVAMTEKLALREGFGDILADGVKVAAEKIGKGAEKYAVHIGGQELGMHDPKLMPPAVGDIQAAAARYQMDATPGRHNQSFGPSGFVLHLANVVGICFFGSLNRMIPMYMNAVTGWNYTEAEYLKASERIFAMRHLFNLREGINPLNWPVHPRITGTPPQEKGPLTGVTADIQAQIYWNLGALDYDRFTTKPSRKKLLDLGFDDIAAELYPRRPR